jgi:hypothetical protein
MMTRRFLLAGLVLALSLSAGTPRPAARGNELPSRLSDRDFWRLVVDSSERDGYFRSDNLTSNELLYQRVIPDLLRRTRPGAVYLGVGPEQNFTYMAAVRPAFAVIFDVRRGNMLVQLMYKALFELARDRVEFVSMLFSKPRPRGVGADSTVADLFAAVGAVPSDEGLHARNLKAIRDQLTMTHGFPLVAADLDGVEYAYRAFYSRGFAIRYQPTYDDLMIQTDGEGVARSYLASEAGFAFLKDLESRNLVVPIVGDFAGPKAIRSIGAYLKAHDATVAAFYLSNVEQYLYQDGKWTAFCRNVAALPLDNSSTFIRSSSGRGRGFGGGFVSSLGAMAAESRDCGR